MRRHLSVPAFVLAVPALTLTAHATTITAGVYTLQNASVDGYTVTGTVTVNNTGAVTAANLIFNDAYFDNPGLPTFNQVSLAAAYNGLSQDYLSNATNGAQMSLFFNTTANANGYFNLCIGSAQCGTTVGTVGPSNLQVYGFYNGTTGTSNSGLAATNFSGGYLAPATSVAVTPEPSTLLLFGTGLLGLAGTATRRLVGV